MRHALLSLLIGAAVAADPLADGFAAPPDATKPGMYWYWLNNHLSATGITRDLETMQALGVGAAFIGHVSDNLPNGDTPLLSPRWWDLVVHAVKEGGRIGVDIGMFNCPGWSQSGGPWVKPEQSMRHLVSRELRVEGPGRFTGILAKAADALQDVAVLAFPVPAMDGEILKPDRIQAPDGCDDWQSLTGPKPARPLRIPTRHRKQCTIELGFAQPTTAQALVIALTRDASSFTCTVSAQVDGAWRVLREAVVDRHNRGPAIGPMTGADAVLALPPTTATNWRIALKGLPGKGEPLAGLHLTGAARVDQVVEKQLGAMHPTPLPPWNWYRWDGAAEPAAATVVDPARVVDLTTKLRPDGTLDWDIPAGAWIVSRVSMKWTGTKNGPTAPEATGPECDKMSTAAVEAMFDGMLGELIRRVPAGERKALRYAILDSYEVGPQNWTDGLADLFMKTYGYDPRPWLPCLHGRVVGSAERSDRFLWDLRRLVADEVGRSYVGGLKAVSNRHGMRTWLENYGHWGFPGEFMKYGAHSDEIAGEFWWKGTLGNIECRAAASTAHAYGFPRVSAESYTDSTGFDRHPALLKARGDWSYCEGINHVVLHVYVHQAYEAAPGLAPWFGQHFNRHNDWFPKHGKAWIDYQRRCCFLLQQGAPVADLAYFIGEDAPIMTGPLVPKPPAGHDFDFINGELVRERLTVQDGRWTLPSGASYRLLVLPPVDTMRPEVLRRIVELAKQGGAVLGLPPRRSPSLAGWPGCDAEVGRLAAELWGGSVGDQPGDRRIGLGRVFWKQEVAPALAALDLKPDVETGTPQLIWKHRRTADADIYFLSNQTDAWMEAHPLFRVDGRQPEIWDAVTGTRLITARFQSEGGRTRVPLALEPAGSRFVIFRGTAAPAVTMVERDGAAAAPTTVVVTWHGDGLAAQLREAGTWRFIPTTGSAMTVALPSLPAPIAVDGPWDVTFQTGRGAPDRITCDRLQSLTDHGDPGVRHFSGTAIWRGAIAIPAERLGSGDRLELDLGRVGVMAAVRLNGVDLGSHWQPPFRIDITAAAKAGANTLEVEVTNTWVNRLLGDKALPDDGKGVPDWVKRNTPRPEPRRIAWACKDPVKPGTKPEPTGLIGPVTVRTIAVRPLR